MHIATALLRVENNELFHTVSVFSACVTNEYAGAIRTYSLQLMISITAILRQERPPTLVLSKPVQNA